jgi:nuclear transport factor 2 (NTF2) superfamily protein
MDERSLSIATIQHVGDRQEGEEDYGFDSRELPDSREGSLNDLPVSAFMQRWAILVMSVR